MAVPGESAAFTSHFLLGDTKSASIDRSGAWVGGLSEEHPVNPIDPSFGAKGFSVAGTNGMSPVTDHAVRTSEGNGYLDQDTESLLNVAYATTGQNEKISAYVAPDRTPFEKALISGIVHGR